LEKNCGAYQQDQNKRPNDRILFIFFVTEFSVSIFVYGSVYFRLVCSQMFSLFLLIGGLSNLDIINLLAHMCVGP